MSTLTNAKPSTKLFIECVDEPAELIPVSGGVVIALCHRCPGRIDPNDDSAAVIQTSTGATVLVVADGMGGGPLGHKASAIAVELIAENVLASTGDDLRPAILDGIEAANEAILDLEVGAATTVAVVEIQQGRSRGYHVGDSQSVIFGGRGAVKWKSTPHSPVGYAIESGMLAESDAMHHEDRHYVSNMVGSRTMHIEIGPVCELSPRDTLIVGSDGLFDNVTLDDVVRLGRVGKPIARVSSLASLASRRMISPAEGDPSKIDDLSILLFTQAGSSGTL